MRIVRVGKGQVVPVLHGRVFETRVLDRVDLNASRRRRRSDPLQRRLYRVEDIVDGFQRQGVGQQAQQLRQKLDVIERFDGRIDQALQRHIEAALVRLDRVERGERDVLLVRETDTEPLHDLGVDGGTTVHADEVERRQHQLAARLVTQRRDGGKHGVGRGLAKASVGHLRLSRPVAHQHHGARRQVGPVQHGQVPGQVLLPLASLLIVIQHCPAAIGRHDQLRQLVQHGQAGKVDRLVDAGRVVGNQVGRQLQAGVQHRHGPKRRRRRDRRCLEGGRCADVLLLKLHAPIQRLPGCQDGSEGGGERQLCLVQIPQRLREAEVRHHAVQADQVFVPGQEALAVELGGRVDPVRVDIPVYVPGDAGLKLAGRNAAAIARDIHRPRCW